MSDKKFFLFRWLENLFGKADKPLLQAAIDITNKVKNLVNSGVVDVFTNLIPGDLDDKIVSAIRTELPKILSYELLVANLTASSTEAEIQAVARSIVDGIIKVPDEAKARFYTSVAARIYIILQDGKVTFGEAAALVETMYRNLFPDNP